MTSSLLPTQTAIYQGRYVVFLLYCFFGFQVLLMQESVKRIIDAEESKMGLWNADALFCLLFHTFHIKPKLYGQHQNVYVHFFSKNGKSSIDEWKYYKHNVLCDVIYVFLF